MDTDELLITLKDMGVELICTCVSTPVQFEGELERSGELEEALAIALTDWCSLNANPCWATGTSILEAADLLVERALENGNLRDD
jgi:hypothetical protein